MTFCQSMARSILESVEGTIGREDRERLTRHLAECAACRAVLAEQVAVKQWLMDLPWPDVSPDFAARVRMRLTDTPAWLDVANWRGWTLRLAPLAALLLALAWMPGPSEATRSHTLATLLDSWWTARSTAETSADLLLDPDVDAQGLVGAALGDAALEGSSR